MTSRRWWVTSLLVLAGILLTVRLGIWQIARYQQNKAVDDHLAAMQSAPLLILNGRQPSASLMSMEYRAVQASGRFDFANQVAVRNQVWGQSWGDEMGFILLTPLVLQDGSAVMVDRGWIPLKDDSPASWRQYDRASEVTIQGVIRLAAKPEIGGIPNPTLTPGQAGLAVWNFIDLTRLSAQLQYSILPVFIQEAPVPGDVSMPYRALSIPEQSEADTNAGFATVWFCFAALLLCGYPFYIRAQKPFFR